MFPAPTHDRTERRLDHTARASSRPGPSRQARCAAGSQGRVRERDLPYQGAAWAPLSTPGALDTRRGELGAGGPRRIRLVVSLKHLGRRLGLDRSWGTTGGTATRECKYCRRHCCSLITYGFVSTDQLQPKLFRLSSFSNSDSL